MRLAHIPVFSAIACTMYFNGAYAYANALEAENKLAMVALALTIDLAKCTFLPAAAHLSGQGRRFGPFLLVLLWLPALGYSTFSGYAYLATTRAGAHVNSHATAEARTRAADIYRQATADLNAAKANPDWQTTGACTRTRKSTERTFCANVAALQNRLATTEAVLNDAPPGEAQPEIAALAQVTGWPTLTLAFLIALVPAVLIELVAGLGLYALRGPPKRSARPAEKVCSVVPAPPTPSIVQSSQTAPAPAAAQPRQRWTMRSTP